MVIRIESHDPLSPSIVGSKELVNRYSGLRDRYYREARETLAAATEEQQ
jgi:hypothetical protein